MSASGRPRRSNAVVHPGLPDVEEKTQRKPRRTHEQVIADKEAAIAKRISKERDAEESKKKSRKRIAQIEDGIAIADKQHTCDAARPPPGRVTKNTAKLMSVFDISGGDLESDEVGLNGNLRLST